MNVVDAATVVLLRPGGADGFEVFLVRRHSRSGFMAGAFVFPGGKLDPEDEAPALVHRVDPAVRRACREALDPTPGRPLDEARAVGLYLAASRELFEEAGVLLGAEGRDVSGWAARLEAKTATFPELLHALDLRLPLDRLVYFAHWMTPSFEPRRFDTRFFLVEVAGGAEAVAGSRETSEAAWHSPRAALEAHAEGQLYLPPPTRAVLAELAQCHTPSSALDRMRKRPVRALLPKVGSVDDGLWILMPWDPLYAQTEGEGEPLPGPVPGWVGGSRLSLK